MKTKRKIVKLAYTAKVHHKVKILLFCISKVNMSPGLENKGEEGMDAIRYSMSFRYYLLMVFKFVEVS